MWLREVAKHSLVPVGIERDQEFESLGYMQHRKKKMLVYLDSQELLPKLVQHPSVSCVITASELASSIPDGIGVAISDDPWRAFYEIHNHLATETEFYWSEFDNDIAERAVIDPAAHVASKNVRIGDGTRVEPGAIIMERSIIGRNCTIRAGAVIGTHGFEFKRLQDGVLQVAHAGGVLLHDRVEIQNNSNVNLAVFGGFTEIGEDSKVDTLVHIGHHANASSHVVEAT